MVPASLPGPTETPKDKPNKNTEAMLKELEPVEPVATSEGTPQGSQGAHAPPEPGTLPDTLPDTTERSPEELEVEGLVLRQLKSDSSAPPSAPAEIKINWSTHKKEGMRLDRLIESNMASFPHMAKMWEGNNKDTPLKKRGVKPCFSMSSQAVGFHKTYFCEFFTDHDFFLLRRIA